MQNASDSLLLFCTPTWPSDHVRPKFQFLSFSSCTVVFECSVCAFNLHQWKLVKKKKGTHGSYENTKRD